MGPADQRTVSFQSPGLEASLRLELLGPLTIARDSTGVELTGPKRRSLLTLLALNAGTPVSVDRIIEALWPGERSGREESTLRVHVSHLRDALEPGREGSPTVLLTHGSAYLLSLDQVDLDTLQFEELTRRAKSLIESSPAEALDLLNEALNLWRGRPLQDVEYEEFAQEEIRRLEQAREEAIEDRAQALIELNEDSSVIDDLESLVRVDPLRERPARLLMRALYRTGRQTEALRVLRRHGRALAELGLEPSPRMRALEEQILQHDPALLPEGVVSAADVRPGRSIRGYELREEAGRGSVGVVYRAFQPSVGREVAVKVVDPRLAGRPEFVRRFAEEARIVAGLEHPHIVPLHDFWREPAGAFLVMRWMDGGSLRDQADRPWAPETIARVFGQLSEALGYAHEAGVIHRDVKPANVLFDTAGNAYLCDFGLAVADSEGGGSSGRNPTVEAPYASPELLRGEAPSVASDVFGLGVMLAEVASASGYAGEETAVGGGLREAILVATADRPADRYPDMVAFGAAVRDVLGATVLPAPRRLRRNPYKGLEPFTETDQADFYGRDDVIETLIDLVGSHGLAAVVGASGSGKSSLVMAGLVPELRSGALPGSDEWFVVRMVPGVDPFEEFNLGLRSAAVGYVQGGGDQRSRELRDGFTAALDSPNSHALLVVDQFEELFSSAVDDDARQRFVENLVDLARDPTHRVRIVVTLRADFSDRPLAHPRLGDLISRASILLAPMRPEQVEEVVRSPAARVGVQVEPGLVAEIIRDISSSPAYLPLLQYVLSELFEKRVEDRLTVGSYRAIGGVEAVLERRAEATYSSLGAEAQVAARQLFLRMVHLGEGGEETRRRLPLTELHGLGGRAEVDSALDAFSEVRLLTYDRDPVSRTPTVEVAHETVISRWARYRIWIDETRADLLAHRRVAAAASTWEESGEDPSYLLTGGPLTAARGLVDGDRIELNELESRFVAESSAGDEERMRAEEERERRREQAEQRSRRRLAVGIGSGAIALVIGVLAVFAILQWQRANDLAAVQERQNTARELAAAAVSNLDSANPELGLLLAIEAAEQSIDAGEDVLPEVVDALHLSLISPRSEVVFDGAGKELGGNVLDYASDGQTLAVLGADGGAVVIDPQTGLELGRVPALPSRAVGVDFHPGGERILTIHDDAVREWNWRSGSMTREITIGRDAAVTTATYSNDGGKIAIGDEDGVVRVFVAVSGRLIAELEGHAGEVTTVAFDNTGRRLVSAASDQTVLVRDVTSGQLVAGLVFPFGWVVHAAWNPVAPPAFAPEGAFALTTGYGEMWLYGADGERISSFGNGNNQSHAVAFSPEGTFMAAAGADGVARVYGTWTGGEEAITLPTGGVPLRDAAFNPSAERQLEVATVGIDGKVRIWRNIFQSELPARNLLYLAPELAASPTGQRYAIVGRGFWYGIPPEWEPTAEVIDAVDDRPILTRTSLEGYSGAPAMSPDGGRVSFTGPTGNIEIVDVETGTALILGGSAGRDGAQAFGQDGVIFASASSANPALGEPFPGSISIWDATSGELLRMVDGHGDRVPVNSSEPELAQRVEQLAFRPGSDELASVGRDGTVRIWNPATGRGEILASFDYELTSMAYSPDGARLAVAERTGDIHVLDSDTGTEIVTPDPVSGPSDLVFGPDGTILAGAGPGPLVHLWDASDGRLVRRIRGSVYRPMGVAFIGGGDELLVLATEGILRRYLLDPVALADLARDEVSRQLSEGECVQYLRHACEE